MKRHPLVTLTGYSLCLMTLFAGCSSSDRSKSHSKQSSEKLSKATVDEELFLQQLTERHRMLFSSLDPEGKAAAMQAASDPCQGECEATDCAFHNKNVAVRQAAKDMAQRRMDSMLQETQSNAPHRIISPSSLRRQSPNSTQ